MSKILTVYRQSTPNPQRPIFKSSNPRSRLNHSSQIQKFLKSLDWLFHKRKSAVFISLKHLLTATFPYFYTKSLQQLVQTIKKKVFASELWVFYRLKNFQGSNSAFSTLYSHISSPRVRTISTDRSLLKTFRLNDQKTRALSKLCFAVNKPMQMMVLKSFWMIFSCKRQELARKVRKNDTRVFEALIKMQKNRKNWVFNRIKSYKPQTRGFLQYFIKKESIIGIKILTKLFHEKQEFLTRYTFKSLKQLSKKNIAYKDISNFATTFNSILKKKAFKSILTFVILKRNTQKILLLAHYIKKFILQSQAIGYFKIKSFSKYKTFALNNFIQALSKAFSANSAVAFLKLKRFSKELMPHKAVHRPVRRASSKLITLPTFFLEGDPSFSTYDEHSLGASQKRRTLFKF